MSNKLSQASIHGSRFMRGVNILADAVKIT